jgi:hypothetical protein
MKAFLLINLMSIVLSAAAFSQTRIGYSDTEVFGQPNIAFSSKGVYFNFGGPFFGIRKGYYVYGLSFYPSLRYYESDVSATIGFGPNITYDNWVFSLPIYYEGTAGYGAIGIGKKF